MANKEKVKGKAWADGIRAEHVAQLTSTLSRVLDSKNKFTLEIGCGHGHWLVAYAKANPEEFCVGIDLITGRIEKSLRKQELQNIKNISFLKAEASEVLDALSPLHKIEKIFILYPDPWPKRRHHKNRFLCAENLTRLAAASTPDATLYFRTDDADYFEWTARELKNHPNWRICEKIPWPFETPTFFEELTNVKRDIIAQKVS